MGRWGDELYESDGALDYFYLAITKPIERDLAFWLSPEQVIHNSWWLAQVLTVVELILLLKRNKSGGDVFIDKPHAVQRWREVFFSVWDGEWRVDPSPTRNFAFNTPDYRKQHREAIMERFNDLERIANYWAAKSEDMPEFPPLPQDYLLPFYSLYHWTNTNNQNLVNVEQFIYDLIDNLMREVNYLFFAKKRERVWTYIEHVWVAVDQLGLIGEAYQRGSVSEEQVRLWREINIGIWKHNMGGIPDYSIESDVLYKNVLLLFDRLEAAAKKYPPLAWRNYE